MRNHVAKAAGGYMKHSTGRGLDGVRIAQATGALVPPSLISRAVRKRKAYADHASVEAKKRRRVAHKNKKELRQPILTKSADSDDVAYKGKGRAFSL